MKINNSLDVARWEKLECVCNMDKEIECFPFVKCEHCRCQRCWDSVPQEDFKVKILDEEGKPTTKTIKEITLKRGDLIEDIIGWEWNA